MIAAYAIYIIVEWKIIPGTVPTHFNAAGKPDNYGSKASLIIEPIIALLLMGLFIFIEKFPQAWNFPENPVSPIQSLQPASQYLPCQSQSEKKIQSATRII